MKVFVSGCFDMLHSGHVAFFKEAATYGDVYVGIGSDNTVMELKARHTINSEQERLYMVKSIKHVTDAFVNRGGGILDFEEDLRELMPEKCLVNEDGHSYAKEKLCKELGIEYIVLERIPEAGLPERSTTQIRGGVGSQLPYRVDLAGTWIDQPDVSKIAPGWAITVSVEPIIEYNERSGMSTSTRNAAKVIWPYNLPLEKPEKLAEILFRYENRPGNTIISGAQDAIGICVPGLTRHYYNGDYWPEKIEKKYDEELLQWIEDHVSMMTLWPRPAGTDLLSNTNVTKETVSKLTAAAEKCWDGIINKDLEKFSAAFLESFQAQIAMYPNMVTPEIQDVIDQVKDDALAWKLSGAGGGGYLILVSDKPIKNTMKIKVRRWNL
ncbi:adenylyltransferase/cytidyltransferase family protein [Wenyingzhuangia sp. 2_MG-2023]|uniref:adenylyltransferase/cytidyltransferase family protein n=1 Tax=Wenyingzhuangia sp. 2_MG-2023 TaxID=3062639 RepID=UPI0026E1AC28|nr:adenylyltransferase/cytidyltransferase family protein [Wenyingzhuangia sp. 2_MG-2023]MDO6737902.1 adenylyltransferase/cytidyltransferase family protein [Wenyingzhuangia sp. 2_MG-2023]MDO6802744.1 adenylyltransferase/cytidyltransferase family protein [Wenyingzhuangia sp. 1_MG-2023]